VFGHEFDGILVVAEGGADGPKEFGGRAVDLVVEVVVEDGAVQMGTAAKFHLAEVAQVHDLGQAVDESE
jgi:hypothetical protein